MLFNFDWWFDGAFQERLDEAKKRCAKNHFPEGNGSKGNGNAAYREFYNQLEARTIVYLRDGFSYELKEIIKQSNTSCLTFECMPADESYKVGCFVVTVPFDDIVRVEIFAVHPQEKPEDMPSIKGFASAQGPPGPRMDERPSRRDAVDRD
jgi:hypothetical protein